ncbi:hypothetical protein D3C84_852720 [compost metagenome]
MRLIIRLQWYRHLCLITDHFYRVLSHRKQEQFRFQAMFLIKLYLLVLHRQQIRNLLSDDFFLSTELNSRQLRKIPLHCCLLTVIVLQYLY